MAMDGTMGASSSAGLGAMQIPPVSAEKTSFMSLKWIRFTDEQIKTVTRSTLLSAARNFLRFLEIFWSPELDTAGREFKPTVRVVIVEELGQSLCDPGGFGG